MVCPGKCAVLLENSGCPTFFGGVLSKCLLEGDGSPLQYSCLENPRDRGAWQVAVHGVAKRWPRLSNFTFPFHFHALEEMTTHSSVLAWRIPGMGELGGLPSVGRTESDTTGVTQRQQQVKFMNSVLSIFLLIFCLLVLSLIKRKDYEIF